MAFDIEGARKAGYSDGEIASFLGSQSGFDVDGAIKSGYQPSEIVSFLSSQEPKKGLFDRVKEGATEVASAIYSGVSKDVKPYKSVLEDTVEVPTNDAQKNREAMEKSGSPDSVMFTTGRGLKTADEAIARREKATAAVQKIGFKTVEDFRSAVADSERRGKFSEDNQLTGSLGSGLASQTAGIANFPGLAYDALSEVKNMPQAVVSFPLAAADFIDRTFIAPSMGERAKAPKVPGTDSLMRLASDYLPKIGRKDFDEVVGTDQFRPWLLAQMAQNSPQAVMQLVAMVNPAMRSAILPTMGMTSAGQNYLQGDKPGVALAKGAIEVGTEMLPLGVFDRLQDVLKAMPRSEQRNLLGIIGKKVLQVGGAVGTQALTEGTEEWLSQVGGNLLDKYAQGKDVTWDKGAAGAYVVGGAMGVGMGAPHVVTAMQDNSPQAQVERELARNLNEGQLAPVTVGPRDVAPLTPDPVRAVLSAPDVDSAISAAQAAVSQPAPAINDPASFIDRPTSDPLAPMLEDRRIRTEAIDAAQQEAERRKATELDAIPEQAAEQNTIQSALERARTLEAPTAMELALQKAKAVPEPAIEAAPVQQAPTMPRVVERTPEMVALPQKLAEQRAAANPALEVVRIQNKSGKFAFTVIPKAAPEVTPQVTPEAQPAVEAKQNGPAATWFGRRGDGYVTEADAAMALPSRQRVEPDLSWQVEKLPTGKFRLAGYASEAVKSRDVNSDSGTGAAVEAGRPVVGEDGVRGVPASDIGPERQPVLQGLDEGDARASAGSAGEPAAGAALAPESAKPAQVTQTPADAGVVASEPANPETISALPTERERIQAMRQRAAEKRAAQSSSDAAPIPRGTGRLAFTQISGGDDSSGRYTISQARYASGKVAIQVPSSNGFKTRAARLADSLARGSWTGREKAYILSPAAAERFQKLYADGWDASTITNELEAPKANEAAPEIDGRNESKPADANPDQGTMFARAYHGTPHSVDKFTTVKIGTGEGAQAYGWGLYFAGKREVADYYRRKLSEGTGDIGRVLVNGEQIDAMSPEGHAARLLYYNDMREMRSLAKKMLQEAKAGEPYTVETAAHQGLSAIEYYQRLNTFIASHTRKSIKVERGNLYEVEIPENENLLDYDKSLGAQSDYVKEKLRESGIMVDWKESRSDFSLPQDVRPNRGGALYALLQHKFGSPEAASKFLASNGIPGMRFKAGQIAGVRGGGYNYVIFDENHIEITAKFKRGTTPAAGITRTEFADAMAKAFGPAVAQRLEKRGVVIPLEDQSSLPAHVVPFVLDNDIVYGFYDDVGDKTYAVLSNLTPELVKPLVLHEVGIHYGFEAMLGKDKYNQVINRLAVMGKAGDKEVRTAKKTALDSFSINGLPSVRVGEGVYRYAHAKSDVLAAKATIDKLLDKVNVVFGAPVKGGVVSGLHQQSRDASLRAANQLANLLVREPLIAKRLSTLDIKTQKMVLTLMRSAINDSQIFKSIVEFVPVDVMDMLATGKLASEAALHDKAMLSNLLSIDSDSPVALSVNAAGRIAELVTRFARYRTEAAASGVSGKANQEVAVTLDALASNQFAVPGLSSYVKNSTLFEEELAYLVTYHPEMSLVREVIAKIKAFLFDKLGIGGKYLTADDMVALAKAAVLHSSRTEPGTRTPDFAPSFARSTITGQTLPNVWQSPDESKLDDFIYKLQDKHVDTKRAVEAVRDAIGQITDAQDPYLQEELYHGRAAMATKEFLEKEIRPLLTDMQARGIAIPDFEEYLHNRHAEARNIQVAKVNPKMKDGGSGIKTADAKAYLANLPADKKRAYEALAKRVEQINKGTRDLLVSSGLEKQSTINAWQRAYGDEYVPLMREEMDNGQGIGQGYSVRGSASKRAMGSDKPVANILANIALQREKTITRAQKRRVGEAVYGLVLKAPNDDFWFAIDPELQNAKNPNSVMATQLQLINMGLDPADAESIAQEPKSRYVDKATGIVQERINPALRSAENVLAVRIDGEDKFIFFNAKDPRAMRMVTALKNLDADQLGTVMGTVAKMTRYFAAVNTQWNPVFGVTNITRDIQTALLNLNSTELKDHKAAVMKHILPALRGIYIDLRDHRAGKQPTSAYASIFEEFQREGGATGYRDMYANAQERAEKIADELAKIKQGKALAVGRGIMDWLSDYNESMENAVRVAAYKVGKEQGLSNQRAASLAKNLTVNFNRKGQVALQAGALYAFFNASVQGSARMAETMFKDGKLSSVGKKIIYGGLLLGSMQALLLAAAGFDDGEPPDFVRERSIVIPVSGTKYISIPMPLGFHVIPNLGRIPTEWAVSGFKNTPKRLAELVGLFADAFNPIGSAGFSMQTLAPTVLDPLAALAENKDWTGKPIAKKDFNSLEPTAGHTRAKDSATPWAKLISYGVNIATGGTDYKPGMASPTPDQIDYLLGQVSGGIGREVSKLAQVTSGAMSGEEVPLYKVPLVGRFVGTTEGQAAEASRFYDNLRQIGEHKAEIDGLRKDHKGNQISAYVRENKEAMLVPMAEKIQRDVSKMNQIKRDLIKNDAPKERVKVMDMQITARMKVLNDRVREMEKRP